MSDISDDLIAKSGSNVYLGTPLELSVETLRGFLVAYEKSGSIGVACSTLGIKPGQIAKRLKVDDQFKEAFEISKTVVEDRARSALVDAALNGVVDKEWEEDGVKYRQHQDFRYLDRLLKDTGSGGESVGGIGKIGGSVLQVNISGFSLVPTSTPEKIVKQEELDI